MNTEIKSQLKNFPNMMTRAVTSNRHIDHNIDEKRSIQSVVTEKLMLKNRSKILVLISKLKHKNFC